VNKKRILITVAIFVVVTICSVLVLFVEESGEKRLPDIRTETKKSRVKVGNPEKIPDFYQPVSEFKKRITKKKFGTYITPTNSPVQPERFSGYHTGVDVEYQDITKDVEVHAIAKGFVSYSGYISGYGGVILITHKIKGVERTVVYGHLAPRSLLPTGTKVEANQVIGKLGKNHSDETDGERRHLHFAILSDNRQDFRGYVQSEPELSGWLNPLSIY
jgi:murein DD-endopeptidase MepM/ murein hydrolase activator NlpD